MRDMSALAGVLVGLAAVFGEGRPAVSHWS